MVAHGPYCWWLYWWAGAQSQGCETGEEIFKCLWGIFPSRERSSSQDGLFLPWDLLCFTVMPATTWFYPEVFHPNPWEMGRRRLLGDTVQPLNQLWTSPVSGPFVTWDNTFPHWLSQLRVVCVGARGTTADTPAPLLPVVTDSLSPSSHWIPSNTWHQREWATLF